MCTLMMQAALRILVFCGWKPQHAHGILEELFVLLHVTFEVLTGEGQSSSLTCGKVVILGMKG